MLGTRLWVALGLICPVVGFAQEVIPFDGPGGTVLVDPPADEPVLEEPADAPAGATEARGDGTTLSWTAPSGEVFTLTTTLPGDKTLGGAVDGSEHRLQAWLAPTGSGRDTVTFGGLVPGRDYYRYVDGYGHKAVVAADAAGTIQIDLDGTDSHLLWVQTTPSTWLLGAATCSEHGNWDDATHTCTLTEDVQDTIAISEDGFQLDCADHVVSPPDGGGLGAGIFVGQPGLIDPSQPWLQADPLDIQVRDCQVHGFSRAQIQVWSATGVVLEGNRVWTDPELPSGSFGIEVREATAVTLLANFAGNSIRDAQGYPAFDAQGNWLGCENSDRAVGRAWNGLAVYYTEDFVSAGDSVLCVQWAGAKVDDSVGELDDLFVVESGDGMEVRAGADVGVYDPSLASLNNAGIRVLDPGSKLSVDGGYISAPRNGDGIISSVSGQELTIVGTEIADCRWTGIGANSSDPSLPTVLSIRDVKLRGTDHGIWLTGNVRATVEGVEADHNKNGMSMNTLRGVASAEPVVTLRRTSFHDNRHHGIYAKGDHLLLEDVELYQNGWNGLRYADSADVKFIGTACDLGLPADTLVWGNGRDGIDFLGSQDVSVGCARMAGNNWTPLYFWGSSGLEVNGVILEDNADGYGLLVRNSADLTVSDVEANRNGGCGLCLFEAQRITVTGGHFADNGSPYFWPGAYVESSGWIDLQDVTVTGSPVDGVVLYASNDLDVSGLDTTSNTYAGVFAAYDSGLHLSDVDASNNGFTGLFLWGVADYTIAGSVAKQNDGAGIELRGCGGLVEGNLIDGNQQGIRLDSSGCWAALDGTGDNAPTLLDNEIRRSVMQGVAADELAFGLTMRHNTIADNGASGAEIDLAGTPVIIEDNLVAYNGTEGVRLAGGGARYQLRRNSILYNGPDGGLGLSDLPPDAEVEIEDNILVNATDLALGAVYGPIAWNLAEPEMGLSVVRGPVRCGNFWGTPSGDGFSQTCEADAQSLCTQPYEIANGQVDACPLVARLVPVCHVATISGAEPLLIDVAEAAVGAHLNHGDQLWTCEGLGN